MSQQGEPIKRIAYCIHVCPSTVSRELSRNSLPTSYDPGYAQEAARLRSKRSSVNGSISFGLRYRIVCLIKRYFSPEQISGYLATKGVHVSKQTIYNIIHRDKEHNGTLYLYCRHQLKHRKSRIGDAGRNLIPDRKGIEKRPPEYNGKTFGDWEMDTVLGKKGTGAILTFIERSTSFPIALKLKGGLDSDLLAMAAVKALLPFLGNVRSITTDNGKEFTRFKEMEKELGTQVFFTDPYSAWQKGGVENFNGLLRQFIPKGTDLKTVTNAMLDEYVDNIRSRPRKKLGFKSSKKCFFDQLKE